MYWIIIPTDKSSPIDSQFVVSDRVMEKITEYPEEYYVSGPYATYNDAETESREINIAGVRIEEKVWIFSGSRWIEKPRRLRPITMRKPDEPKKPNEPKFRQPNTM